MPSHLSCFLYTSRLAPEAGIDQVSKIVKQARELNTIHGISGVLVFDGERFAQYIEGPSEAIGSLVDKLAKDPRHTNFQQLLLQRDLDKRMYEKWSMGYLDTEMDHLNIESLSVVDDNSVLQFFSEAVAEIDGL